MKHKVYLILGSNIEPEKNTITAIHLLTQFCTVLKKSSTWETVAVGSKGPNFLNVAVLIETDLSAEAIKADVIGPIEKTLGRVRTNDKNAPRTIDLDIVLFDDLLIEPALWKKAFIAIPMADLLPEQKHPHSGERLIDFIHQYDGQGLVFPHPLKPAKNS
jgi:2-amino-4-hydroxy-6-hydroxymethyldihydropteridine diphosphokinase